jgi:hypothetical protein
MFHCAVLQVWEDTSSDAALAVEHSRGVVTRVISRDLNRTVYSRRDAKEKLNREQLCSHKCLLALGCGTQEATRAIFRSHPHVHTYT